MTDNEKYKIAEYREKGYGYKRIAQELNVPVGSVKTFCIRNNIVAGTEEEGHFCKNCGKPVIQQPGRKEKKFCSDKCRMEWWNSNLDKVNRKAVFTLTCQYCHKEFTAYAKPNKKYCSRECYFKARFGEKNEHTVE